MYTCHLSVLRRSLVEEVGGFDPGFEGSQDWDLVLKVTERARSIVHVPRVLYHWRALETSTAGDGESAKPWAFEAGQRAVQAHCERIGLEARVERDEALPGVYHLHPALTRRAEGEHRHPHQRPEARGPLRGGRARRALRPQHRRDVHLRQLRDRLRGRLLDGHRADRRADGGRGGPPARCPIRSRIQFLRQDQSRRRTQRGRAAAAAERRHGGGDSRLDRASDDVRAASRASAPSARACSGRTDACSTPGSSSRTAGSRVTSTGVSPVVSRATPTTPMSLRTSLRSRAPA